MGSLGKTRVFTDELAFLLSQNQGKWSYYCAEHNSMISDALQPNVQDLQTDVIDLLGQISSLMHRASTALSSDSASQKYGEFQQEVVEAARNVKNLELMMAIVAPMKAGKSTIINAIVGQEILPSRNAAMTTLPTEIIFNAELIEPTLTLNAEILSVFQETLLALQHKLERVGIDWVRNKLSQHPYLMELLEQIQAVYWVSSPVPKRLGVKRSLGLYKVIMPFKSVPTMSVVRSM